MNAVTEFEGFSVWLYGESQSNPAVVNDEPFTLGVLATVLIKLANFGASNDDWQQTAACLQNVLKPGKGTTTKSLAAIEPHEQALELDFNVVGGAIMTPVQGTVAILRNKSECPYASVSLALNPWMLSGPGEWLDRISYDLYWAALLCGYDGDHIRRGGDEPTSGNKVMIFENAKTHCVMAARYNKKPATSLFYVKAGPAPF